MSKFTEQLVDDLADRLLIGLSREENKMVLDEFNDIDKGIARLTAIEGLDEVEPMTHCLDDFAYVLREDIAEDSVDIEDLLKNSDDTEGREIVVPKVVG